MSDNRSMGFIGWLTLMLIGLKLTGYIHWHWALVFAPVWVPFTIVVLLAGIVGAVRGFKLRQGKGGSKV